MKLRWILLLSDRFAELYHIEVGRLLLQQQFEQNTQGLEAFSQWLTSNTIDSPMAILVDIRDESYQLEKVPQVSFYDINSLLKHKLKRLFKADKYTYAEMQDKSMGFMPASVHKKSKANLVLLTSLSSQNLPKLWIKQLLIHEIALQAVYSLPLLSHLLLPKTQLEGYRLILTPSNTLSGDLNAGVRQFFFKQGQLLFSRLLILPSDTHTANYMTTLQTQVAQTLQYLKGVNLLSSEDKLPISIVANQAFLTQIQPKIAAKSQQDYQYISFNSLDIGQQLSSSNIKYFYFRHLMVLYLANASQKNHYANTGEQQYYQYWLWRRSIYLLSAACLLATLSFTANDYYQAFVLEKEIKTLEINKKTQQQLYLNTQIEKKQRFGLSTEVIHIKNTIDSFNELDKQRTKIQAYLIWLSHYLTDSPQLYINEINWEIIEKKINNGTKQKRILSNFEQNAALKRHSQNLNTAINYHVSLSFLGYLQPFDGNRTAALKTVTRLIERIEADKQVLKVTAKQLPLSVDPSQSLDGIVSEQKQQHKQAVFHLIILFKTIETVRFNTI